MNNIQGVRAKNQILDGKLESVQEMIETYYLDEFRVIKGPAFEVKSSTVVEATEDVQSSQL